MGFGVEYFGVYMGFPPILGELPKRPACPTVPNSSNSSYVVPSWKEQSERPNLVPLNRSSLLPLIKYNIRLIVGTPSHYIIVVYWCRGLVFPNMKYRGHPLMVGIPSHYMIVAYWCRGLVFPDMKYRGRPWVHFEHCR